MCGICGFTGPDDRETLDRMTHRLRHRGPDDHGVYSDGVVSLGHRRLSIIDLTTGRQPLANEDGSVLVVFNGEIYNHRQLRQELKQAGHQFHTESDTESIVHAYEQFGPECVSRLDGMFSFVLYDKAKRQLFGARDRFGKKPLYYCLAANDSASETFLFASELKSLREHPLVALNLRLDRRSLCDYLLNDYTVGARSIFEGVHRLPAGHAFCFGLPGSEQPGFRCWRYWNIHLDVADSPPSFDDAADEVLRLLAEAVERRLMADVPLGTFLSGGIDSSAIVAMLTRYLPPEQIQTFSIAFDEASFDESAYAKSVADYFGTTHRVKRFSVKAMLQVLPDVVAMLDEPFADPSVLPVSMLCQFAREHVTVALGGDGGDELFAGYDPFRAVRWANRYSALVPATVHEKVVRPLSRHLPASTKNMPLQFKVERFLRGMSVPPSLRTPLWMGPFEPNRLLRIAPGLADLLADRTCVGEYFAEQKSAAERYCDPLDQTLDFFERFYLTDDILVKVDRASMMHSLEVRAPFLDTQLAEYVNRLPRHYKLSHGRTKALLKHALAGRNRNPIVPRSIVHRAKKGFGIPVAHWIRHELRDNFREMLLEPWPASLDVFNRDEIDSLLNLHIAGKENNYKELWALFMLSHWARLHWIG